VAAPRRPDDPVSSLETQIRGVEEELLAKADEIGLGEIVEFDHDSGGYYPTRKFEDSSDARRTMERYEDDFFWAELVRLLTKRDLDKANPGEYEKLVAQGPNGPKHPIEERYWEEFFSKGLDRMFLMRDEPAE